MRCACADEYSVRLLTAGQLDAGEAEGLVQAREKGARFFIADERRAREIGERQGLTLVGSVRLIARLCLEGYAHEPRTLVEKLRRERRFRVAEEIVKQAIADAPTPI